MYFFTGNNLFGQWIGCKDKVIEEFRTFPEVQGGGVDRSCAKDNELDVKNAILVHIGWSHNIFKSNRDFYITGDYKGSGQCLEILRCPENCSNLANTTIVSDDYRLVIVSKDTGSIWTQNMENNSRKPFRISTEAPIESEPKRTRKDCVIKCTAANGTLMFVTREGLVYSGLPPSLIDTSHCMGKASDIQCGYEHCMMLSDAGRVYTWGNGRRLQLGHGDISCVEYPTEIEALAGIKIVKIAAGGWHSLAVSEFGDLYAWGWNDTGQLGIKENSDKESLKSYPIPTLVDLYDEDGKKLDVNIMDAACGSRHSSILVGDAVWTSGNNNYGQLGFSKENHPSVSYFKKSCSFKFVSGLICGQWSTVVISNE